MENKRYIYAGRNITTNMRKVPAIPVNMDIKTKLAVVILFSAVISLCLIVVIHRQKRNEALQSETVLNSVKDGENVIEMLISKNKNVFKQEQFEKGGERKEIMDQENDPHVERKGGEENDKVGKELIDDDKYEENEDGKINDEKDDNAEEGKEGDEGGEEPTEDRSNGKDIDNEVNVVEENEFDNNEEVNDNGEEKEDEEDGQFADFHDAEKYFKYANLQMVEEEEDDGEPDEDDPEDGEEHEAFGVENVDDDDGEPNAPNELFDDGEDEEYKPIDVKTGKKNIEDFKRDEINVVEKDENRRAHELQVDDDDIKNVDNDKSDHIDVDDDGNKGDPIGGKKSDNDDDTDDGNNEDGNAGDVDDEDDDDENGDEDNDDDDDGIVEEETDIEHKIVHDET